MLLRGQIGQILVFCLVERVDLPYYPGRPKVLCSKTDSGYHNRRVQNATEFQTVIDYFIVPCTATSFAASLSLSLSQLGYPQNIIVKGSGTQTSFYFPLPKADLQNGTINLYLEPSQYLNAGRTFAIFLNDQAAVGLTAGQLRQNPLVKMALPPGAAAARGVTVSIRTGLFTTDDLCVDWRKGYLFYSVLNKSNLQANLVPPSPQTIPDFFAGLYQGLAIILPPAPTKNEIVSAIWLYGALQKSLPYQNFQLIVGVPKG